MLPIYWIHIWWLGRPLMFRGLFEMSFTLWHRMEVSWCGGADPTQDNIPNNKLINHFLQPWLLNDLWMRRRKAEVFVLWLMRWWYTGVVFSRGRQRKPGGGDHSLLTIVIFWRVSCVNGNTSWLTLTKEYGFSTVSITVCYCIWILALS